MPTATPRRVLVAAALVVVALGSAAACTSADQPTRVDGTAATAPAGTQADATTEGTTSGTTAGTTPGTSERPTTTRPDSSSSSSSSSSPSSSSSSPPRTGDVDPTSSVPTEGLQSDPAVAAPFCEKVVAVGAQDMPQDPAQVLPFLQQTFNELRGLAPPEIADDIAYLSDYLNGLTSYEQLDAEPPRYQEVNDRLEAWSEVNCGAGF